MTLALKQEKKPNSVIDARVAKQNIDTTIDDAAWVEQVVDLAQAVGSSEVQIRWTYGSSDSSWNYCGWNIDDVVIEGAMPCTEMHLFADDFESGGCNYWSRILD